MTSGGILTFGVYTTVVNTMATAASVADGAWRHAVGTGWGKTEARLVAAIHELKAELDAVKAELAAIKGAIAP